MGGVRYAYRDARRYAGLQGLTLRGTVKIWDTSLAHIGMMWAKRQGRAILRAYTRGVYLPFWRRELDAEDPRVITAMLEQAGADVAASPSFSTGEGRAEHDAMQPAIFDAGIFGVPTYVVEREIFFGREHLPRIRWILGGRRGPAPDIAYRHFEAASDADRAPRCSLAITRPRSAGRPCAWRIDFKQPQSYLAKGPTQKLAASLGIAIDWLPMSARPARRSGRRDGRRRSRSAPPPFPRATTSSATCGGTPAPRAWCSATCTGRPDSSLAGMGLLWAKKHAGGAGHARCVDAYVDLVFDGYWREGLRIEDESAIRGVLERAGVPATGFDPASPARRVR